MTLGQVDLLAEMVAELRDKGGSPGLIEQAEDEISEFWNGYEPTDMEMSRTSRSFHDLDGYALDDPKRVTLQRENGRI
jgi:hypothetical protein